MSVCIGIRLFKTVLWEKKVHIFVQRSSYMHGISRGIAKES